MPRTCQRCNHENTNDAKFCLQCGAMLEMEVADAEDPLIGKILLGRYRVTKIIGEGGMGKVYLAEQKMGTATRNVAIKTLHPELLQDPQLVARFHRECETVITLTHPNTVQFYDFGEFDDNTLFIVMEYIEGESLALVLQRGALDPRRAEKILVQICGSLAEAHQQGVVHRDLKPENVLLTDRGGQTDFVKVLDFGIAKRSEAEDESRAKLTKQGMVLGTPPYMSPEQFSGQTLDARSDIYSLGIMTYEMLAGKLPFEASTPWEWATKHLTAQPAPLTAHPSAAYLPEGKSHAVMRALAKNRDERFATVNEYMQAFTGAMDPQQAWTMATSGAASAAHPGMGYGSGSGAGPGYVTPQGMPRSPVGTPGAMQAAPGGSGHYHQPVHSPPHGFPPTDMSSGFGAASSGGVQPGPFPDPSVFGLGPQKRSSSAGLVIGIVVFLIFILGGGGAAVYVAVSGDGDAEDNSPPPRTTGPLLQPIDAGPALQPLTPVQDAGAANVPSTPDEGNRANEQQPQQQQQQQQQDDDEEEPTPSGPTPSQLAAAERQLQSGQAAANGNDLDGAIAALQGAQRVLGRSHRGVQSLRGAIANRGSNRVGILMQQGNCPAARTLYRKLSSVGAAGNARQHFGDWCQP